MPAPRLTWNPDEAAQNKARADDLDRACKDAVAKDRYRACEIVVAIVPPSLRSLRARLINAIRSGEPAPEAK
jgi:hypothetical protein